MAGNEPFSVGELFENMGLWHSWEHHGHFSKPDRDEALAGINDAYTKAAKVLQQSNRLLLTLGTADVFWLAPHYSPEKIVANNHKMPAALFQQKQLSVGEVTEALTGILSKLTAKKPDLQVVLSVSPVRHLRNGMVENQRSKAVLLLACAEVCRQCSNAHYFPAYELLLDDLRDYRFYAADMIHPSDVAVDYIWQYFANMFFSPETRQLNHSIEKILAAARHRPFNPDTPQHQSFVAAQLAAIQRIKADWPQMDFSREEALLQS
jgi:lysophospholipase L1-like esterase